MSPQPPQAPRSPPGTEPGARRAGRAGRRSGYYHNVIISFCFFVCLFFYYFFFLPNRSRFCFRLRRCRARSCGCSGPSPSSREIFIYLFMCRETMMMAMIIMTVMTIKGSLVVYFPSPRVETDRSLRVPAAPSLPIPDGHLSALARHRDKHRDPPAASPDKPAAGSPPFSAEKR